MRVIARKRFTVAAALATTALSSPAFAQAAPGNAPPTDVPPVHSKVDQFGVDLVTRNIAVQTWGSISIGPNGPGGLNLISSNSNRVASPLNSGLEISGSTYSVYSAGATTTFTLNGTLGTGTFTNTLANGATLSYSSSQYTFTSSNGTVLVLTSLGQPLTLTYPAGQQLTWHYDGAGVLRSVTTNLGYQYRPTYNTNGYSYSKAVLFNMANESCDPLAVSCTLTNSWPNMDFVAQTVNGNPMTKWMTTNNADGTYTATATIPVTSSQNETLTYQEDTNGRVTSVTDGNGVWTYSYDPNGGPVTYVNTGTIGSSSDPYRQIRQVVWDRTTGEVDDDILTASSGNADVTYFSYDSYQRLSQITRNVSSAGKGVTTTYTYDGNGNITQTVTTDTNNANPITTSAVYPSSGCNTKTCNQPTSTTDGNGNTTNYTYDPNSGGVATITQPAAPNGIHPQTRYTYTLTNGIYLLTATSACQTTASCAGTADEVKTTIGYDSHANPISVSKGSGDGALTATTAMTYTPQGDVQTIDGPLAGTADTSWFSYDLDHRLLGTIGPLPGGGQNMRAASVSYTAGGDVDTTSIGTASAQSTAGLSGMVVLKKSQALYSAQGLKTQEATYDNTGAVAGIIQYNYTPERMLQCTAVRNTLTSVDACSQTSGGKDLITKTAHDDLGNLLTVRNGYRSDSQTPDLTNTYINGSIIATQQDGNGNTTTYGYDTFNRLSSTCYADSSTDCAKITLYDNSNNPKTVVNRAGQTISLTYDALNRVTAKTLPEGVTNYTYDLLGHVLTASEPGYTLTFTYDALGRQTNDGQEWGAITRTFDLAGRLTQVNWWDGFYVNYDRLTTGEISKVRENGATTGVGVLATYAYDALGNRTSLTFGNGAVETSGYDSLYRLHTITNNLSGTANDVTRTLGYNPASEITSAASTNSAYAFPTSLIGNVNRGYTPNSLNQYASVAGKTFSYDANGDLTGDGTNSYSYTSENMLKAATVGGASSTLYYDPLGRLTEYDNSTSTRFQYDGPQVAAELNGSTNTITNRYVWGDSPDELLVWYEGSDTSNRRFISTDERGSVISATDSSGNLVGINSYDEYGIPGSTNIGRFQYTGQMYLPQIGMYNYKARMFSTTLGRFMQTDPIGYHDRINWYAYAHNDPVNGSDPSGLLDPASIVVTGTAILNSSVALAMSAAYARSVPAAAAITPNPMQTPTVRPPTSLKITKSCQGVSVLTDPQVQASIFRLFRNSLSGNDGPVEWGFYVSQAMFGSNWIGPEFSDDFPRMISQDTLEKYEPSRAGSILSGYWPTPILIHTHPNDPPISPVGSADAAAAANLDAIVVAVDKSGNLTCTRGK